MATYDSMCTASLVIITISVVAREPTGERNESHRRDGLQMDEGDRFDLHSLELRKDRTIKMRPRVVDERCARRREKGHQ